MTAVRRATAVLFCCVALAHAGDPGEPELKDALRKGQALYRQGKHREAGREFETVVRLAEKLFGPEDARTATHRISLAAIYARQARLAEAEALYQRGLAVLERDGDGPDLATALHGLAALHSRQGRYADAEPRYLRALKIREAKLGPDHADVASTVNGLAVLHQRTGRYAEAESLFRRALKIREARFGADHTEVAASLNNLAGLFAEQGRLAEAEPLQRRCLTVWEKAFGPDHPETITGVHNLAALFGRQGRYAEAEPLFRRALAGRENASGKDHPEVAYVVNNLAWLYDRQGRFAEAEPLYRRALAIREAKLGPRHPLVALTLNNLAASYVRQDRLDEAAPLLERALRLGEAAHGGDHPELAAVLNNLAEVQARRFRYAEAEALYRRALKIWEGKGPRAHPEAAAALHNLAGLDYRRGKYAGAEALYRRSLAIRERELGEGHPSVAATRAKLAMLLAATDRADASADLFERALRGQHGSLRVNLAPLGPPQQLAYLTHNVTPLHHLALTLAAARREVPGMAERAAGWLLNGKGLTHEALAEPLALARAGRDPELKAAYQELLAVRGRAAFLTLAPPGPGAAKRRDELAAVLDRERELAERLARALLGRPPGPGWVALAALRRALPAGAVFLDFARYESLDFREGKRGAARYLACVVPAAGQGEVELIDLGPAGHIDGAVKAVRHVLDLAPPTIDAVGEPVAERGLHIPLKRLAELVLKPLPARVAQAPRWIVGPDAALWLVPFEMLPLPDGRYAVEAHAIRYVTSGRDLLRSEPAARAAGPALVLADPDYDGPAAAPGVSGLPARSRNPISSGKLPRFARLPGTALEATTIAPALKRLTDREPELKTGPAATEEAAKAARGLRYLVLCTHGYFLPDQEAALPEFFAGAPKEALSKAGKPLENPLLRCGLALAGANKKGPRPEGAEDGILTGLEVVGCDLGGTELVVLSACETGLGQVNVGEGVAGLRQAFHLAGAKAVLASLWRVPDRETAELMSAFFAELEKGGDHAQALRRAQLRLLRQRRELDGAAHPFFWAAFTLTAAGS